MEPTTAEERAAMRHQYSKQGEDVGVLALIDHVEELEPELEKARELLRKVSMWQATGAGERGLLEEVALEGSK